MVRAHAVSRTPDKMTESDIVKYLSPRQALNILWERGLSGRDLLREHSAFMDSFICGLYEEVPEENRLGITLVALGGYGRQEHFPFSDVDLMVLYTPEAEENLTAVSEAVFYPLWDAGLDVGHGVRTVANCLEDALNDFFLQVALIDARFICGDPDLFSSLVDTYHREFIEGRRREFAQKMMDHRQERHRRFGDHAYLLEPNIKESRGGFRDIQATLWTSRVLFGIEGMDGLVDSGLISMRDGTSLKEAHDTLIRIRNRLHYVSGRKNDRLYFEYQEEIAKAFRHYDSSSMLGVERFMGDVYACMETVGVVTDLFFEHVQDTFDRGAMAPGVELESGIELVSGRIHIAGQEVFKAKPFLMMKVFELAAANDAKLHYRAKRIVSSCVSIAEEDRFRRSRRVANSFMQVLAHEEGNGELLRCMLETGLLKAYIPEFEHISALAQHDVYHVNTVDRHVIQTVVEVRGLFKIEKELAAGVNKPVLLLAALLHDIGKGLGGGHAIKGARLAEKIGARMGLSATDLSTLVFLVRNHLFLFDIALRRDLEDETLILKCARRIKDPERLRMLLLLTMADAKATGPNVWNEWKAALLLELYHKIAHLLEQSELIDPGRAQAVEWMQEKIAEKLGEGGDKAVADLPEDYLLSFTPEAVIRHMELRKSLSMYEHRVMLLPEDRGSYWSILIVAKDRTGLLARIFGILALHNMQVLDAQIFTLPDGVAIDTIDVRGGEGQTFDSMDWDEVQRQLGLALAQRLSLTHRLAEKFRSGLRNPIKTSPKPIKAVIDNESSDFFSIIEVFAEDNPGLLYNVTSTLADLGINIYKAKIATNADQAVDVFYVLDKDGNKIHDSEYRQEIRSALTYAAECVY